LPEASRFYDVLAAEVTAARSTVSEALTATAIALDALIACIEAKRDSPFSPGSPTVSSGPSPISLGDAIMALNVTIDKHNQTSARFKASVDEACKKLEASYVAEAYAEYRNLTEALTSAEAALEKHFGSPAAIQGEIDMLEREILEHRRPADELTEELRAYLGRGELRFEVKGSGYALTRVGLQVSHLSEGERTAIALLYFLKSLQDKTFDMAGGIVVIDDPVSSLDANALFSAFGYIKDRTKQCGQLFILTHNFPFFRLVKNWFHHLARGTKGQPKPTVCFLQLNSRCQSDGSRSSTLSSLDPLLREHESEYQYLFKRIHNEAKRRSAPPLEEHYGLPNLARRLLEAFLAFRYPELSGKLYESLERVDFDGVKKTRLLRLLHVGSHADSVRDPDHDLTLLAETQPVLCDLLDMMKTVDPEHYAGLEKLVGNGGST
jgi:wobble nucleotide-excising tRNase